MELSEVMRTTGSIRELTDEPVAPEVLHAVLDSARFAPSGGNRQGWHVVVARSPEVRRRLSEHYAMAWREYAAHAQAGLVPFAPGPDGHWHGPEVDLAAPRQAHPPPALADQHVPAPLRPVDLATPPPLAPAPPPPP